MTLVESLELLAGVILVLVPLWDAFETVVLPRTVRRKYRLTRVIVLGSWAIWRSILYRPSGRRESVLAFFGPSVLILLVLIWAVSMILGFGLIFLGLQTTSGLDTAIYFSGSNFFTLGLGDVIPKANAGRGLVLAEAGTGFGFLAIVIGYLPIFYQSFSRREIAISLLDSRAGSPPTALELIRRNGRQVTDQLVAWENWAAELLESHPSYPILALFRSQHDKQSWLASLTVILDTSALAMTGIEGISDRQARFTYAIARHALVDLTQIFYSEPRSPVPDRLDHEDFQRIAAMLHAAGLPLTKEIKAAEGELAILRRGYEPFANALGERLLLSLPPWIPDPDQSDDWQVSPWDRMAPL
jgi:Ion channel